MKKWMQAARLRTLPLALSGVLCGIALAPEYFNWVIAFGCILTATTLQILSNFANDYGDFKKGTDNENRIGPARTMQLGLIDKKEMKQAIVTTSILALIIGLFTVLYSVDEPIKTVIYIIIAGGSVAAAIKYTVGNNAYGYKGYGDIFVFIFFGLASILGTKYLLSDFISMLDVLVAIAIGLFSTSVLNLNNMRDIENDTQQHKYTLVTKMGLKKAFFYHNALINIGLILILSYTFIDASNSMYSYICLLGFPLMISHILRISKKGIHTNFDPELKKVALSTFFISVLFTIQECLK